MKIYEVKTNCGQWQNGFGRWEEWQLCYTKPQAIRLWLITLIRKRRLAPIVTKHCK